MAKNDSKHGSTNGVSNNGTATNPTGTWAGAKRKDGKIRVAIVGVGNCASSLIQGRYYYENAKESDFVPGLMHVSLGGYHVRDIEFVAAFDINKTKVGKDLSEAIYAYPNNTIVFQQVPHMGVTVDRGMTHDGLGKYLSQIIEKAPGPTADVVGILKEREVDVMVSYLPVGSEEATKWYAEQALKAGVGFVNAIPVFIGREPYWQRRFAEEGLPIIGDDIKSQVGATITHRVMTRLFMDRGVRLDRTYQLNFGGNTDFLNMLERERLESKKISKTNAVTSMLDYELEPGNVHVGPERPRAVADRPQVLLHPDGRHDLRRRAAQGRAQAGGLGQPELRRRHHGRDPLPEARSGPRPQGDAGGAVQLLHEEPAAADPRRHRVQPRRGVHPGR
jgi:myo-inositol-1-phosphate synthase